jgi:hypothetical protein
MRAICRTESVNMIYARTSSNSLPENNNASTNDWRSKNISKQRGSDNKKKKKNNKQSNEQRVAIVFL